MGMRKRKAPNLTLGFLASAARRPRNRTPVGEDLEFSLGQGELELSIRQKETLLTKLAIVLRPLGDKLS